MDLLSIFQSILAFVAAIGILVTIHEFGHYWVARLCGVKVLRFSVGFGKPLWIKKAGVDQTEYVLASIPLGGYVKMLDEREGEVAADELDRTFNRQHVSKRFAIVAAGPMFNFLFAIAAYSLMYISGVNGIKPYIGEVTNPSIAWSAGVQEKDLIMSINGIETLSWEKARLTMMQEAVDGAELHFQVQGKDLQIRDLRLDTRELNFLQEEQADLLNQIGLGMWRPQIPPQIDEVLAGGAAEAAGLKAGDDIISLNGNKVDNIRLWVDLIRGNASVEMPLVVRRDGQRVELLLTPRLKNDNGNEIGYIGVKNVVVIPEEIRLQLLVVEKHGLVDATLEAIIKTWQMSALTLKVLGKLVVGEASVKNLSGPITIAKYAGLSAQIGLEQFFSFLAIISISLGVLNLLPVPMLDGGHLMYYCIEILKGSPVSEGMEAVGQRIGMALLMMLMTIAIYNDVLRLVE
ncbi:MAG: RIP metalloprotease RseP [Gammaproteobacteria bacterium]|jgi:regulator of sigma E protease|nr:RIP metalloprotease RseP [Gammaproteobacteria bacterium]MBT3723823.1 RIP metalloprotease RseP [Gammaproteobacteria bacterium]MBT4078913.1 RIP metalloprotease RseP [Gammaproteobacteria bacterium]MBT4196383.1 RIP metalloprotease RseP [Gammaproteobacteria bacterium]MBT4448196.1 RIP metalloprotease RseP [Gammaproteobacteria bacterium]